MHDIVFVETTEFSKIRRELMNNDEFLALQTWVVA